MLSHLNICHKDSQLSQLVHAQTVGLEVLGLATVRNADNIFVQTVSGKKLEHPRTSRMYVLFAAHMVE